MNSINLMNVPSKNRLFCLTNYNAFAEVADKNGNRKFIDLPLLAPIFARSLEEAKEELAKRIEIPLSALSEWECVGEEDGFCPSICTGYKFGAIEAGYSFDVYTTVNTIHLLEN